jgi:lipopolysaccharide transport system ATP-binding protein
MLALRGRRSLQDTSREVLSVAQEQIAPLTHNEGVVDEDVPSDPPAPPILDEAFFDHLVAERAVRSDQALKRWGSYEAEITGVELLDAGGVEATTFRSGETLTVRMHFYAHRPLAYITFGMGIYHENGVQVTAAAHDPITCIEGTGSIDCRFETLPLHKGHFFISVSIYDETLQHAFDHQHDVHRFTILDSLSAHHYGLVALPYRWTIHE